MKKKAQKKVAANDASKIRIEPSKVQQKFLSSQADIAVFGGSAGGGKSYSLLIEPLRHLFGPAANGEFGAVIFRRNATQVRNEGGLWHESQKIYGALGAHPREMSLEWTFPCGGRVRFAHLEYIKTVYEWQGSQVPLLCCEENEKILMADGAWKRLAEIVVGDYVKTLQGARKVLFVGNRRYEECVKAEIGNKSQIHSVVHKILTSKGWLSYAESYKYTLNESRPAWTFVSTLFHFFGKFVKLSANSIRQSFLPLCNQLYRQLRVNEFFRSIRDYLNWPDSFFYRVPKDLRSDFESSVDSHLKLGRLPSIRLDAVRFQRSLATREIGVSHARTFDVWSCARIALRPLNFLKHCLLCFHQYGVHATSNRGSTLIFSPSQGGAAEQSQMDWLSDDPGITQKHNHHKLQYTHPYRGTKQTAEAECDYQACTITPCGKHWVIDLTIESDSHYITETGLVNQNCFDELTHFEEEQFFYMLSRNRSTCGVPAYVRATTNPDADSWVRRLLDWWIDPVSGFPIPERTGKLRWLVRIENRMEWGDSKEEMLAKFPLLVPKSVTFIPAKLEDNEILMKLDPGYLANLMAQDRVERERLLDGNWNVRPSAGMYFRREFFRVVEAANTGHTQIVRAWDRAATVPSESNRDPDFTVGLKLAKLGTGAWIILDVVRFRGTPLEVEQKIRNIAEQDGPECPISLEEDPGASGKADAQNLVRVLAGFDVQLKKPSKDKETRARPVSAQAEAGNILIVRAPWNEQFLKELENFPEGSHDDCVDALSNAFNELAGKLSICNVL